MGNLGNEIYILSFLVTHPVGEYEVTAIHVGVLLVTLLQLVLSGVLLDGAHTARASRCKPWLYFNGCLFPVSLILIIVVATEVPDAWYLLIPLALQAYMLLVVWVYVRELGDPTWTSMAGWGLGGVIRVASQALAARMRSCWARKRRLRSAPATESLAEPLGGPHDAVEI